MSPFDQGYQDGLNYKLEDNHYTHAEHAAYKDGYDKGVFECSCLFETYDQSRDEHGFI
jgi:hypothetical protein